MNKNIWSLLICILLFSTTLFSSCTKEDSVEEEVLSDVSIVGKWKIIEYEENFITSNSGNDSEKNQMGDIFQFKEDNTYKVYGSYQDFEGKWYLNGNKLTCLTNGITWTYTITELTEKRLTFYADYVGVRFTFERVSR